MADLSGYPDFGAPLASPEADLIAPFGQGAYSVLPRQLVLAMRPDGSPKFELDLVNCAGDFSAGGQYAELDFSLSGDYPLAGALALARQGAPTATVKPVAMDGGFGRLYATVTEVALPADVLNPVPLGWWTADLAHWTTRLSSVSGELLKDALQAQSALLLGARVEASVAGVAPRLPVVAQFEPSTLLTALLAGRAARSMPVPDVLSFFSAPMAALKVTLTALPACAEALLAQIMTDRMIASYATLTPAPAAMDPAYVQFRPLNSDDASTVSWDLNEPTL